MSEAGVMNDAAYSNVPVRFLAKENSLKAWASAKLAKRVEELHPAYFALVMATGIISTDCYLFKLKDLAFILFAVNIIAYCSLCLLFAIRAIVFHSRFTEDWSSHKRAFGFFTVIAATNVLGTQINLLFHYWRLAEILFWIGLFLWLVTTYGIFVLLIVKKDKPSIETGINGGWLVSVVATESICVLGCQINPHFLSGDILALFNLSFWLFGGMLYIWLISLIVYRYMFFSFEPTDLIPPYWINMGAMAITTLAGCELGKTFASVEPISQIMPFVKGLTTMYWATASWWIPMLFALGVWRHGVKRLKFSYDPLYWGLVFPLGMYSVCTLKLSILLNIPVLSNLARLFIVVGLIAWLITFLSMAKRPLFACLFFIAAILPSKTPSFNQQEENS